MTERIIAKYEVTYHSNGFVQTKYLISKEDWEDFVKPITKCIATLPKDAKTEKGYLKSFLKFMFGDYDNVFPIGSPFHKSVKTGILELLPNQGGEHKVSWKFIEGNKNI